MSISTCRDLLRAVGESLQLSIAASQDVRRIEAALSGADEELSAFLESNELWGGSGSIADQAGIDLPSDEQKCFNFALYELGLEQLRMHVTNVRTSVWVDFLHGRPRIER